MSPVLNQVYRVASGCGNDNLIIACYWATASTSNACWVILHNLQIEVTVSQSDWHKIGSVDNESTNSRSCNWWSKLHGKMKHSWSMISF